MNLNKKIFLIIVLCVVILLSQTPFVQASLYPKSLPYTDGTHDVLKVVNYEYQETIAQPSIDIVELGSGASHMELQLTLLGNPILDKNHGYRIIISWEDIELNLSYILNWPEQMDWNRAIPPLTSFTTCVAGGIRGFDVTNGSYTVLYDDEDTPIFTEINNNTVTINNNTLIFPVNHTLVADTTFTHDYRVMVFTTYNETFYNATSTAYEPITWMDAIPDTYLVNLLHLLTLDTKINLLVSLSLLVIICTCQVILIKRRQY